MFGLTTILGLQTFIIIGGVTKLIPLTGVTLPFISYGGTSIVVCTCMIGIIQCCYLQARKPNNTSDQETIVFKTLDLETIDL